MSPKIHRNRYFYKLFTDLLQGPITAREALIFGIVADFEVRGLPCFISRQELANRINESPATAERSVKLLLNIGLLKAHRKGRKRYLSTGYPQKADLYQPDTGEKSDLYQSDTHSVSKSRGDLYQLDTLDRSILDRSSIDRSNNKNITGSNSNVSKQVQESERERFKKIHGFYYDELPE